jgi:predicted kinase
MKGLPGAGKTTRATELSMRTGAVIVSRDELRTRPRYFHEVDKQLAQGNSVVADATNFTTAEMLEAIAAEHKAKLVVEFLDTPVEVCIERDYKRGSDFVGAAAIRKMHNEFLREDADAQQI